MVVNRKPNFFSPPTEYLMSFWSDISSNSQNQYLISRSVKNSWENLCSQELSFFPGDTRKQTPPRSSPFYPHIHLDRMSWAVKVLDMSLESGLTPHRLTHCVKTNISSRQSLDPQRTKVVETKSL